MHLTEAAPEPAPVAGPEFSRLMAPLGPFEPAPEIAVAVSGGPDSLALTLLAEDWARANGGRVNALTVDHGLRPESAAEARQVGQWLSGHGIAHNVLPWTGAKPTTGVQAAARDARYRLLQDWCQAHDVLHLLLAHQRDDQAETFLLRLGRGSGSYGLATMAGLSERAGLRLLRPLLSVPKARLRATLAARGQDWIEDPSNHSPFQTRARLRAALPALERQGLGAAKLAATAHAFAEARAALEGTVADLLGRAALIHPAGFAQLEPAPILAAPIEVAMHALGQVLMAVSGAIYSPRQERLERLYLALGEHPVRARTLAGCRVIPRRGRLLICREPAAANQEIKLEPDTETRWDGRFTVSVASDAGPGLVLKRLGETGWRRLADADPRAVPAVPPPARAALPSIWHGQRLISVPLRLGDKKGQGASAAPVSLVFSPIRAAAEARFAIVSNAPAHYL